MPQSGTGGDASVPSVVSARRGPGVGPWLKPLKASRGEAVCDDALSGRADATSSKPAESARLVTGSGDDARYHSEPLCDVERVSSISSEHCAEMILEKSEFHAKDLLALFEMLPFEDCPRSDDSGARAFGGGAYMKGGIVGLRANSRKHPSACKAFASAIRFAAPAHPFTSFSVHADAPTTTHVDRYNADVYNIVLPLTRFEGGGIWLQDASGCVASPEDNQTFGVVVVADIASGPCAIDARNRKHTVMPWTGARVVLVGFSVSAFSKLSSSDAEALASLGFNLDIVPIGQPAPACASSGLFDLRSSSRPAVTQTFDDNSAVQPLTLCKPSEDVTFSSVGKPARLLVIEACCGCARLSATLKKDGFDVLPLDCEGNRHRPLATLVSLDLRKPASWEFLQTCVLTNHVFHFHGAPPCGTASRARDRPMSSAEWGPPPLRSERYPQSFPWLSGTWRDKVESANLILPPYGTIGRGKSCAPMLGLWHMLC